MSDWLLHSLLDCFLFNFDLSCFFLIVYLFVCMLDRSFVRSCSIVVCVFVCFLFQGYII